MMNGKIRVLAAAALLSACATARIDVAYKPTDAPQRLSISRMPRLLLAEVDDRTPGGLVYTGMGLTTKGQLTRPIVDTVRDALRTELGRLGVPLAATRSEADAVLKAAVTALSVVTREGANVPMNAALSVAFQLRSLGGDLIWSNEITGQGSKNVLAPGIPGTVPSVAMNLALASVMAKMSRVFDEEGTLERVFAASGGRESAARRPTRPSEAVPEAVRSDVDELPSARAESKRRHAVVIGVERYRENLPRADFAASDARSASEYFRRVLGVPEANTALLIDERATKSDFEKHFERWLPNRVEAGDEVFVYFSGHGTPNPAKGDAYLVPYDGDPTYIDQTGYPLKRLYEQLAKLPAKSVLVAMDSCFSGAGGRSVLAKGARPLVMATDASSLPANVTVLAAAAGDQISNSYQEKGHGLFTYFLLKGLKEKGADFKSVFNYLKPEVAKISRREYNADQVPQWREGK
ncbi:MAG: caspase family protein [Elusimicrobia bacterium]|nr:caspase family protein [Elusimicrobiota bacterium]